MKLQELRGKCFLCGMKMSSFDTTARICECIGPHGFPESELACYVTILPEPPRSSILDLPSLWASYPSDIFAIAADGLGADPETVLRQQEKATGDVKGYPYAPDLLAKDHHLRCGNALVYRSSQLEALTGSELVLVLDMGPYYWSGTLKDPRSWAIINTAIASHTTDIAVWTAGNAGVSLAKLAYLANRRLPPQARLQVHAIVDNDVAPEIRARLRLWQCELLDVFRQDKPVLNPEEIRTLVAGRLRRSRRHLDDASYWHVTDGWDGVGLLMYRMIAAQVIRDLTSVFNHDNSQPLDIVLPVGTGDLFLGFYLGLKDCEDAGLTVRGSCRLVGALPTGANILANIRHRSIPAARDEPHSAGSPGAPVMPKLASLYTPLAPCLARIEAESAAYFILVTQADQLRAGRQVLSGGIDDSIVAEPSALAAFAALPHLAEHTTAGDIEIKGRSYQCPRRILVINSGFGLLGLNEETILRHAIGM